MENTIVVLKGYTPLEDRSWCCHQVGEADRLAKWLTDTGTEAMACTKDQWNAMQSQTFKDWPKSWGWSG